MNSNQQILKNIKISQNNRKCAKLEKILESENIDLEKLRSNSWNGIPDNDPK